MFLGHSTLCQQEVYKRYLLFPKWRNQPKCSVSWDKPHQYNLALDLCYTWINLFAKIAYMSVALALKLFRIVFADQTKIPAFQ